MTAAAGGITTPGYIFAGQRQGWRFVGLKRIDLPPNSAGVRYTEFRNADGSLAGLVQTHLLAAQA